LRRGRHQTEEDSFFDLALLASDAFFAKPESFFHFAKLFAVSTLVDLVPLRSVELRRDIEAWGNAWREADDIHAFETNDGLGDLNVTLAREVREFIPRRESHTDEIGGAATVAADLMHRCQTEGKVRNLSAGTVVFLDIEQDLDGFEDFDRRRTRRGKIAQVDSRLAALGGFELREKLRGNKRVEVHGGLL
jgi:hypothetical protein